MTKGEPCNFRLYCDLWFKQYLGDTSKTAIQHTFVALEYAIFPIMLCNNIEPHLVANSVKNMFISLEKKNLFTIKSVGICVFTYV